jgi:hypothetical protein
MRGRGRRHITPIGWVVLAVLVAAALVAVFADGGLRALGVAVGGIVLLMLVAEAVSGTGDLIAGKPETLHGPGRR